MKQRLITAGLGALLVCGATTAIAAPGTVSSVASGVGDVISGDDNGSGASTSQVGTLSARPSPRPISGTEDNSETGGPITGKQDTLQGSEGGGGAAQPTAQTGAGGGGGKLPFTGYLAIPVLVLGAGMLGAGFVARRRAAAG